MIIEINLESLHDVEIERWGAKGRYTVIAETREGGRVVLDLTSGGLDLLAERIEEIRHSKTATAVTVTA